MVDRDALQQQAIRKYNDLHQLLKKAKKVGMPERAQLLREAEEKAKDAKIAVDKFFRGKP